MDKNNSFDWLAVKLQSQDKTFDDLYAMGVDPMNTTLETKDFYKEKGKIKEMYKTKDGKFDDKAFDLAYLDAQKSYNEYQKADVSLNNVTADLYDDTSITRYMKLPTRKNPVQISLTSKDPFSNLKVAQKSFLGLTEINKWTSPKKSIAEVAQGQKVIDGLTGKETDYTPEDTGLFNLFGFFNEPLVLASYDADIKDPSGKVIHKRGELKFDEKGLPRYETLAGRDPSGKKLLSRLDTFTKEDSYWNKMDFMDSDDLKKSITGSVVKAAVQYAPMLIGGPLGTAYTAYSIASGLLQGGMEITKALDGIANGPEAKKGSLYKWANQIQGYTGQWQSGVSEHSQNNFATWENLLNLAVDSVYQLKSQKALVQWPEEIRKYQMAKELGVKYKNAQQGFDVITDVANYEAKYGKGFMHAVEKMSQNVDELEKYRKYASYMSTAYMAATSAVGISEVAENQGLDAKDKGFLYLGYVAALIPLFRSDYGKWVEGRIGGIDDLTKNINSATTEYAKKYFPELLKESGEKLAEETGKGAALRMMNTGKELAKRVYKLVNIDDARTVAGAMAGEGVEEMTEQTLQNVLQGMYNGLASAGIKSTQEDVKFDMDPGAIARDIAMAGIGGALGGAIFHFADRDHINAFQSNNLMEYVTEGHGQKVLEAIEDLKSKGQLGSTTLSAKLLTDSDGSVIDGMFAPVNEENKLSQNDFIGEKLFKTVRVIEDLRKAYNIIEPNITADNKNKFFQNLVDTKTDTDLRERIHDKAKEIYALATDIGSIEDLSTETTDGLLEKKARLKNLQKDLEYLQGDDSLDEFFRQGLFNVRRDISSKFGVKNQETIALQETGKAYNQLTKAQQLSVDKKYQEYVNTEGEGGLRSDLKKAHKDYETFQENMESGGHYGELDHYKQSLRDLEKYVKAIPQLHKPEDETSAVAQNITYRLAEDFLTKMEGVKYVPDYIFKHIQEQITMGASRESDEILSSLTHVPELLKNNTNTALREDITNPTIQNFLKKIMGESDFEEFMDSDEYKDIRDNKVPNSNYSTVKLLKKLAEYRLGTDTSKYDTQLEAINNLKDLDDAEVSIALDDYFSGDIDKTHHIMQEFAKIDGLLKYVDGLIEQGLDPTNWEYLFFGKGPQTFATVNFINSKIDGELTEDEKDVAYRNFNTNNIYSSMLLDGKYNIQNLEGEDEQILADIINGIDTSMIDEAVDLIKNFDRERLPSPVRKILESSYEFAESEMENLKTVGPSNYSNGDADFVAAFDSHMNAIDRVAALIEAAATVNPLVNDFRVNHKGLIDSTFVDEVLFQMDDEDKGALLYELGRLKATIKYLKDINDYNRNNLLQTILKEDGLELIQKVRSLRDIAGDPEVVKLIPSIMKVYETPEINDYFNTYKTDGGDLKLNALHLMAKIEHAIYLDVQKLGEADKAILVNKTFTPIRTESKDFYDRIDADKPLNSNHRTTYLATIFGTSSLDFYVKYAGEFDVEAELYRHIEDTPYVPFAKQEGAVRLANLVISGDRKITEYLFNSYTYEEFDESEDIDYTVPAYNTAGSPNSLTIFGSPGTGKTTAVLSYIMNMVEDETGNTLLLGPRDRHVETLRASMKKVNMDHRINDKSDTIRDFLQGLGLKKTDGSTYNFEDNDKFVTHDAPSGSTIGLREDFSNLLNRERNGIFETLAIYKLDGSLNDEIFNALSRLRLVILDEFTHVNPLDVAMLNKLINLYNSSPIVVKDETKRITVISLGDDNQLGYVNHKNVRRDYTTVTNNIISQPLLTSLRTGWDLINNTLVDITRRTIDIKHLSSTEGKEALTSTEEIQKSKNNPIKMFHYEGPEGTIGMKTLKATGDVSVGDLQFITSNKTAILSNHPETGKPRKNLVYVVNSREQTPKAEALMRDALGMDWKDYVDIYTPTEVQGGEYKYAIIHAKPLLKESAFDIVRIHEFLNTMLSRATEATLLVDDGTMDQFMTFENVSKPKATNQIKITPETLAQVKANKQALMRSILRDYLPEELKKTPEERAKEAEKPGTIPVVHIEEVKHVFTPPKPESIFTSAKVSNITAYSTFSTKEDFDTVYKLIEPTGSAFDVDKRIRDIERVIYSYKYYLLKRKELGEDNVLLAQNFKSYFAKYNYNKPTFYVEATKREGKNVLFGRTEINPKKDADSNILLLKVKVESKDGSAPLVLTMGSLNDIIELKKKFRGKSNLDDADRRVNTFIEELEGFLNGVNDKVSIGEGVGRTWKSKEFSQREWDKISQIWGSRLLYNDSDFSFNEVKELYPDFHITDPHVVVATLVDDANKPILDPTGKNPEYFRIWSELKGKSVAFLTEYKELQGLSADELLDIYIKQMEFFANDAVFMKAKAEHDLETMSRLVNERKERIKIRQGLEIKYQPNMVKMIRLDNPKASFLNFRERYITAMKVDRRGKNPKELNRIFEKFDMSPYVKDRLLKSLLTIREFLKAKENHDWFQENVIKYQNEDATKRIQEIKQDSLEQFGEVVDFDSDFPEVALQAFGALSLDDFRTQLEDLLFGKEQSIIRGKYGTKAGSSARSNKKVMEKTASQITDDDLKLELTPNKQVDFSESIIDLNLLNLFKKTKNLNFAELIDLSLNAFATKMKDDPKFAKYQLSTVFKDGEIETVVISNRTKVGAENSRDNVLDTVHHYGKSFKFGFKGLQLPAYNIDFDELLKTMTAGPQGTDISEEMKEEVLELQAELDLKLSRLNDPRYISEAWLESKTGAILSKLEAMDESTPPEEALEIMRQLNTLLDSIQETIPVDTKNVSLDTDTVVAVDVTSNGVVFKHTVGEDIRRALIEKYSEFKGLAFTDITLSYVESDEKSATFEVETEEDKFKVKYTLNDRQIDVTRLFTPPTEDIAAKFRELDVNNRNFEQIFTAVTNEVSKNYLQSGDADIIRSIGTREQMLTALGEMLSQALNKEQYKLLLGNDYDQKYDLTNIDQFNADLTNAFLDTFARDSKEDIIRGVLGVVNSNLLQLGAEGIAFEGQDQLEEDEELGDEQLTGLEKFTKMLKGKKGKEVTDPMEKLKQDLKDANKNAKELFEMKMREIFKGAETKDPLKTLLKNEELLFRRKLVETKLKAMDPSLNLADLGVDDELASINPLQLSTQTAKYEQDNRELRAFVQGVRELRNYTKDKTKTEC